MEHGKNAENSRFTELNTNRDRTIEAASTAFRESIGSLAECHRQRDYCCWKQYFGEMSQWDVSVENTTLYAKESFKEYCAHKLASRAAEIGHAEYPGDHRAGRKHALAILNGNRSTTLQVAEEVWKKAAAELGASSTTIVKVFPVITRAIELVKSDLCKLRT